MEMAGDPLAAWLDAKVGSFPYYNDVVSIATTKSLSIFVCTTRTEHSYFVNLPFSQCE